MTDTETATPPPSTVLILLGQMLFEPSGEAEVLSVKIFSPDEVSGTLAEARQRISNDEPSLNALHIIVKASSIPIFAHSMDEALSTFLEVVRPGVGTVTVHILGNSPEMPLQNDDVGEIRALLLMAGLKMDDDGPTRDGGWILETLKQAQKEATIEEEEDEEAEDEKQEKSSKES